jgi:hypothetical protein
MLNQPICKTCSKPITAPSDIKYNKKECNKCRTKERVCTQCLTKFRGIKTMCQTCKNKNRGVKERVCKQCRCKFTSNLLRNTCAHCHGKQPKTRFIHAKYLAKQRNIIWSLTIDQYINLIKLDCYYCDGFFEKVEYNVGLDRLNNAMGYEIDNVVSCCYVCNTTRNNNWTPEETRHIIQAGIAFRNLNKLSEP